MVKIQESVPVICRICENEFELKHFNQKLCSLECKKESRKLVLAKHKKTDSWKISNKKWVSSEKRKSNELGYRKSPRAKALAVKRSIKHLKSNQKAYSAKKRRDSIYIRKTQGRLKSWWLNESRNGCKNCGSLNKLSVDHVIPISLGGSDDISNLQCLCFSCNSKKGSSLWLN